MNHASCVRWLCRLALGAAAIVAIVLTGGCRPSGQPAPGTPATAVEPAKVLSLEGLPTVDEIIGATWRKTQDAAAQRDLAPGVEAFLGDVTYERYEHRKVEEAIARAQAAESAMVSRPSADAARECDETLVAWLDAERAYFEAMMSERRQAIIRAAGLACRKAGLLGGEGKAMLHYPGLAPEREASESIRTGTTYLLNAAMERLRSVTGSGGGGESPPAPEPSLKRRLDQVAGTIVAPASGEGLKPEQLVAMTRSFRTAVHQGMEYVFRAPYRDKPFEKVVADLTAATLASPDSLISGTASTTRGAGRSGDPR